MKRKYFNRTKKFLSEHKIIIILLILALLLRLPWLYTTIHKDEGHFGYIAWQIVDSGDLNIKDNKPFLLYIIYSIPILLFGNSIILVRLLNNILFLVSIIFFFKLTEKTFSKKIALPSTLFYIFFMNIPVFEGYFALSESLLTPFLIASIYFFEKHVSTRKSSFLLVSSILAIASFLIKQQSAFIFILLAGGVILYKEKHELKKIALFASIPILIMLIILLLHKQFLVELLQKTWMTLIQSPLGFSYGYRSYPYNLLIIVEGSLLFLFAIVGVIQIFKSKRKKNSHFFIFWLILALIFAIIPPAYGHYFIFLIPPLAIFAGIGIYSYKNKKFLIFLIILLLLPTIIISLLQFPNTNLDTKHLKCRWSSLDSYDQQIKLVNFIKEATKPEDEVYMIEWEPVIYWLSERRPPIGLFYYDRKLADMSYLKKILENQKELKLLISLRKYKNLEKHFDFISNKKMVHGVNVYDVTTKIDPCYFIIAYKTEDKDLCELIAIPSYKQYCLAMLNLDFNYCYNITRYPMSDECFLHVALKKNDPNICNLIGNKDFTDFCNSRIKGNFDYDTCMKFFGSEYKNDYADYKCKNYYARFTKDINICEDVAHNDFKLLCKLPLISDKIFCENVSEKWLYNLCMAYATLDINYCRN